MIFILTRMNVYYVICMLLQLRKSFENYEATLDTAMSCLGKLRHKYYIFGVWKQRKRGNIINKLFHGFLE